MYIVYIEYVYGCCTVKKMDSATHPLLQCDGTSSDGKAPEYPEDHRGSTSGIAGPEMLSRPSMNYGGLDRYDVWKRRGAQQRHWLPGLPNSPTPCEQESGKRLHASIVSMHQ